MMTPVELKRKGFQVLVENLGYADAIRFIHQFESGQGDYTLERDRCLNQLTIDEQNL